MFSQVYWRDDIYHRWKDIWLFGGFSKLVLALSAWWETRTSVTS